MQLVLKAATSCKFMQNASQWAIHGHQFWYRLKAMRNFLLVIK